MMEKKVKSFAIYCSGGAARVLKFYAVEKNRVLYKPIKVIYDGGRAEIIGILTKYFPEDLIVFDVEKLKSEEKQKIHTQTSRFIHKVLAESNAEYLLCFGDKILKKEIILAYKNKLINFHPSLLPSFKGLQAIDQALKSGVGFLGNTAHFIDEGIDTGSCIIQTIMLKHDFENYEDVLELQFPMIKIILRDVMGYTISEAEITEEIACRKKKYLISFPVL